MSASRKTFIPLWAILLAFATTPKLLANSLSSVVAQSSTPTFDLPESLPNDSRVTVSGTSSMTTVNEALKQRYEDQFPNAEVQLETGNSDEALEALQQGEVDIAAVGRPLTAAEKAAGLVAVPVDRGKIAIIVGPDNPFRENLTFEQFAQIFRGEITDWSEVGGEPGPIRLVDRPEFSDTRRALSTYDVFKTAPFATGITADPVSEDETETVIEALGSDGIGYAIADHVVDADNVSIISMHQTLPDDPRYPYSQVRNYVYQQNNTNPATQAFLGFATSEPGQEAIAAVTPNNGSSPEAASTATVTPDAATDPESAATPGTETPTPDSATDPETATTPGLVASPGSSTATPTPETLAEDPATTTDENGATGDVLPPPPVGTTTPGDGDGTDTETALKPNAGAAAATTDRGFPWWLPLLLAIPILGGLLWWLLKGRGGEPAGITSIPPGSGATATPPATGTTPTPPATPVAGATGTIPETPVTDAPVPPVTGTEVGGTTPTLASPDGNVTPPNIDAASPITSRPPNFNLGTAGMAGIAGAVGAAAGAFAWARRPLDSQITLSHREPQSVYGVWNVPQADMDAAKQQGGQQFQFRVYDVTHLDMETDPPHSMQPFDCEESTQELQVTVPQGDRDYCSEVGYVTDEGEWLPLCRSNSVYVPASNPTDLDVTSPGMDIPVADRIEVEEPTLPETEWGVSSPDLPVADSPTVEEPTVADTGLEGTAPAMDVPEIDRPTIDETPDIDTPTNGFGLPGIALGGAALAGAALPFLDSPHTQLRLTPGENQTVIADWDITPEDMDAVKQQGGEQFQLRVYDITDIDIDTDPPNNVELFDCDESTNQTQVPVPQGDRDYAAAIGYVTADNRWLPLCRSNSVYIPISETPELGMTPPSVGDIETPEVETPPVADTDWGITPPSVGDIETPEVETPPVADTDWGITSPEMDTVDTPEIAEPATVDETPDIDTPTSGIGLPGMALGGAALAGAAIPFLGSPRTQLRLTPAEDQTVIADWNLSPDDMDAVKQQGGEQLQLRVYDITDIDIDTEPPRGMQQYDCDKSTDQVQVSVPQGDRDYAAAIGYITDEDQWLPICCSESVYVPAADIVETDTSTVEESTLGDTGLGITSPEITETDTPTVEEPTLGDTGLGITSPEITETDTPTVEESTLGDTGLGITSPEITETDTPTVEEPTLADTGLGITSPEVTDTDTPAVEEPPGTETNLGWSSSPTDTTDSSLTETDTPEAEEPTTVNEPPETETPTSGISFPGMALGGAALAGAAIPFLGSPRTQLRLTPGSNQTVIANWDITQEDMDTVKQQGGEQLQLRVYDVTDIDIDTDLPHSMQQYDCDESTDQIPVSVPQGDGNYAAAIGYVTDDDRWLPLCCSESIYVPAADIVETDTPDTEEPTLADTGLGITSPEVTDTDSSEIEASPETEAELGWSLSPTDSTDSTFTETDTPETEEPTLADTGLGITSPEITDTDTPTVEEPVTVEETANKETPSSESGLPGMATGGTALVSTAILSPDSSPTQLNLTTGDNQTVIADWNLSQGDIDAVKQQGGQRLQLRIYDVTDIDINTDPPHSMQQYDCDESTDQVQVSLPQAGCDYIAEIGYATENNQWLPLCRSDIIFIPALFTDETAEEETSDHKLSTTGEDSIETATPTVSVVSPPPSQLNLVVIADQMIEASWEIPQADIDAVKQQGGQQLQLRVYDVTETDLHTQALDTIQQYDCDEASQELQVSIPQGECNYAAAIGYVTDEDEWLPLCCSDAVYVPALQPVEVEPTEPDLAVEETPADEPSTPVNLTDVALGSAAAAASIGTIAESVEAKETPAEATLSEPILPGSCEIQDLTVHSRHHCFLLNDEQMTVLQETAVSHSLEPGLYIVRIKSGTFGYGEADSCREPVVLLWISGGQVINKKTNISVESTWSSLNGYDETLTLEVIENSTLRAFFFDTNPDDNYGEVTLSVIRLDR